MIDRQIRYPGLAMRQPRRLSIRFGPAKLDITAWVWIAFAHLGAAWCAITQGHEWGAGAMWTIGACGSIRIQLWAEKRRAR